MAIQRVTRRSFLAGGSALCGAALSGLGAEAQPLGAASAVDTPGDLAPYTAYCTDSATWSGLHPSELASVRNTVLPRRLTPTPGAAPALLGRATPDAAFMSAPASICIHGLYLPAGAPFMRLHLHAAWQTPGSPERRFHAWHHGAGPVRFTVPTQASGGFTLQLADESATGDARTATCTFTTGSVPGVALARGLYLVGLDERAAALTSAIAGYDWHAASAPGADTPQHLAAAPGLTALHAAPFPYLIITCEPMGANTAREA